MDDHPDTADSGRTNADEALAAVRQADRVDFALRIAQSLQGADGAARPLALAFQETVSRVVPPEATEGEARQTEP